MQALRSSPRRRFSSVATTCHRHDVDAVFIRRDDHQGRGLPLMVTTTEMTGRFMRTMNSRGFRRNLVIITMGTRTRSSPRGRRGTASGQSTWCAGPEVHALKIPRSPRNTSLEESTTLQFKTSKLLLGKPTEWLQHYSSPPYITNLL